MPGLTRYEKTRKWKEQNKEQHAQQQSRYFRKNKDRLMEYQRNYRLKKKANAQNQESISNSKESPKVEE